MRDFDKNPYTPDEERVAKWLVDTGGVGGGDDPIGYLIAAFEYMAKERKAYRNLLLDIKIKLGEQRSKFQELLQDIGS